MNETYKLIQKIKKYNYDDNLKKVELKYAQSKIETLWNEFPNCSKYENILFYSKEEFYEKALEDIKWADDLKQEIKALETNLKKVYLNKLNLDLDHLMEFSNDDYMFELFNLAKVKSMNTYLAKLKGNSTILTDISNPWHLLSNNIKLDLNYNYVYEANMENLNQKITVKELKQFIKDVNYNNYFFDGSVIIDQIMYRNNRSIRVKVQSTANRTTGISIGLSIVLLALIMYATLIMDSTVIFSSYWRFLIYVLSASVVLIIGITISQRRVTSKLSLPYGKYSNRILAVGALALAFYHYRLYERFLGYLLLLIAIILYFVIIIIREEELSTYQSLSNLVETVFSVGLVFSMIALMLITYFGMYGFWESVLGLLFFVPLFLIYQTPTWIGVD
jgi:hypothetical protein